MDTGSETHVSLLERLKQDPDDQRAWHDFVDRYGPKIHAWCRHWRLQPADAEDVTQGLLMKLVGKLGEFTYDPDKGSFRGWLKTLTHHAWYDFLQARRNDRGSGDTDVLETLHTTPARDDLLERLKEEFDLELYETAKDRVQTRVAPHTWQAFCLLEHNGAAVDDVAKKTGLQVAMVYVARSKVKKMLTEEIAKLDGEAD